MNECDYDGWAFMYQRVAIIPVPSETNETNKRHMQILYLEVWMSIQFRLLFLFLT